MATRDGNVHHLEFGWEYDPDNYSTSAGAIDITGIWIGLQFDMRHSDTRGTFHTLVFGRDHSCF